MGLALRDLVSAGLTALELRAAGFSVMELKQAGITSVQELRKAGFDLVKLKAAFDIHELHDAGYSFNDLLQSGVDEKSLIDAGFGAQLEMQVGACFILFLYCLYCFCTCIVYCMSEYVPW